MEKLETDEKAELGGVGGSARRRGRWGGRRGWWRWAAPRWAAGYGRGGVGAADAVAGLTLGLTLVPQSIAYATLADLPVHQGLHTAFIGTMVYVFAGGVKEVSMGPTSLMALVTLQACRGLPPDYVVLLTFLSGCIVLLMGVLRLGFLVELISPSVTSGFTSATALVIVVTQLQGALGLAAGGGSAARTLRHLAASWRSARLPDCALAATCCLLLLLLRKLPSVRVRSASVRRALWLVSIARNALVVLACALLAAALHDPSRPPIFLLSKRAQAGLPAWRGPPLWVRAGNATEALPAAAARLGGSLVLVPMLMLLANVAIAKAFSPAGRVAATRELVALGLCNAGGALAGAMPAAGAFTRAALAHCSGVRSPAAGLYSGGVTLLAMAFLTPYFFYIPKACLSAVLICAVIFMVDLKPILFGWRRDVGSSLVTALTLAVGVAVSVELCVAVGAAADLARLLHALLRAAPETALLQTAEGEAVVVKLPPVVEYLNAERVLERAARAALPPRPLLLDASALWLLGPTALTVIERVAKQLEKEGSVMLVFNASASSLERLRGLHGVASEGTSKAVSGATSEVVSGATSEAVSGAESIAERALHVRNAEEALRLLLASSPRAPLLAALSTD